LYVLTYCNFYFRQLKAAKERLRRLQDLVNQVHAIPGLAAALPDDISAELSRQSAGTTDISSNLAGPSSEGSKTSQDVR
jgi:hypothetical protein